MSSPSRSSRLSRSMRSLLVAAGVALVAATPAVAAGSGSLDPTFNPSFWGTDPSDPEFPQVGEVHAAAPHADGTWVFSGDFNCAGWHDTTTCTGVGEEQRSRIAQARANGSIDATFDATMSNFSAAPVALAMRPDGKVLAGGNFTTIGGLARNKLALLNADGTADAAFNPNLNNKVEALDLLPDGKIMAGGWFTTVGGTGRTLVARLNADGTVDTGFTPPALGLGSFYSAVLTMARQEDGKVIIGGNFTCAGWNGDGDCTDPGETVRNRIARLNADGTLDASFNPGADSRVESIVVQPDGKLLIGGYFTTVGGVPRNSIARLNADGTVDTSFNPSIGLNLDSSGSDYGSASVRAITLQPDGKVLVGGEFTCVGWDGDGDCVAPGETVRNRIARLNADGTVDPAFNPSLALLTYVYSGTAYWEEGRVNSMIFQPDGSLVISGYFDCVGWDGNANCTGPGETVRGAVARLVSVAAPTVTPAAPTAVAGDARATVSWAAVPGDITGYSVTSSPGGKTCTATAPATSCVVEGLTNGTEYTFTVKASNAAGEGPTSAASNAVTPSGSSSNSQTAAEDNPKITIPAASVSSGATLTSTVSPSVAGTVKVTATLAGRTVCTATKKATRAGRMTVTCNLTKGAKAVISKKAVTLKVTARLTDAAGKTATASRNVKVARYVVRTPVTG